MYRKVLIAFAAAAIIALAAPLDAVARHGGGGGGGGRGGGWHGGGGFRGASIGRGFGRGFRTSGMRGFRGASLSRGWRGAGRARFAHRFRRHGRFFAAAPFFYAPYAYYGCYQLRPVPTPWGLVWQRVWVCY